MKLFLNTLKKNKNSFGLNAFKSSIDRMPFFSLMINTKDYSTRIVEKSNPSSKKTKNKIKVERKIEDKMSDEEDGRMMDEFIELNEENEEEFVSKLKLEKQEKKINISEDFKNLEKLEFKKKYEFKYEDLNIEKVTHDGKWKGRITEHKKPVIAIVGKPNVGKSSLFNSILRENKSLITEIPGTTRDRIYGNFEWRGHHYIVAF